jgi:hypothetical protein
MILTNEPRFHGMIKKILVNVNMGFKLMTQHANNGLTTINKIN